MDVASLAPDEIKVRRPSLDAFDGAARHWFGGDPIGTHYLNALSVTFPRGERMFVDAVRAYRDRVADPVLAEAVRRFVGQETQHSRAHEAFNDWVAGLPGLRGPVDELRRLADRDMDAAASRLSPEIMLAVTAALEHFTAILAHVLVEHPTLLDEMDAHVRPLWLWHALEELEHKAVAIDVYRHVGGSEAVRRAVMAAITALFVYDTFRQQRMFLRAEGRQGDLVGYARFARRVFGRGGYLAGTGGRYLAYYRADFHPWQPRDRDVLARARARLAALGFAP